MTWQIIQADCVEAMSAMDEASVDAIVCDPPYGLEFMGREWDKLDADLPQEAVWKGRRGNGGSNIGTDDSKPGSRHHVALGAGKQHGFKRCQKCGKRQFSGSPCQCAEPDFALEYRQEAPSSSLRMQRWHEAWAREAYRVLKPGGHLLAFGGTRTYHRLACAIEDAGFEIRDCLAWMYGSGFPKSLDVSKAIDKSAGAEREATGTENMGAGNGSVVGLGSPRSMDTEYERHDKPVTAAVAAWQGWGTALKPAYEPVVLARKPLSGTVAQTVLEHGTGALNVDGCRIAATDKTAFPVGDYGDRGLYGTDGERTDDPNPAGRWPANVMLDESAAEMVDEASGERTSGRLGPGHTDRGKAKGTLGEYGGREITQEFGGDTGGASRFFYTSKASSAERNRGVEYLEAKEGPPLGISQWEGQTNGSGDRMGPSAPKANHHPTVKPVDLMQWLCRLITPPKGTILDPFTGSGSTGIAALRENFSFVGIEREPEYVEIARARIIGDSPLFNPGLELEPEEAEK